MDKTEIIAAMVAGELINMGIINARLAPISIDAAGLAQLGFVPDATLKTSKLYNAIDLPLMRAMIIKHLATVETSEVLPLMQALFVLAGENEQDLILATMETLANAKAPTATRSP